MNSYKIISDTASDIYRSVIDAETLPRVPFYVTFDKEKYEKEHDEISIDEFYRRILEDNLFPSTSCPTIPDYMSVFEPYLEKGMDILCICISSLFSGSYQSAVNAAAMLSETYPERTIKVVDSLQATGGQALIVCQALLMRKEGYTLEENFSVIEKLKLDTHINWTVSSLDFLQKGGRIGKAKALAGTLFNVKPILAVEKGEVIPTENVRGLKKAVKTIIDKTDKEINGHESDYILTAFFSDTYMPQMDSIVEHYSDSEKYTFTKDLCRIGVTIGSHAGLNVIALAYSKKYTNYEK